MSDESHEQERPRKRGALGRVLRSLFLMGLLALIVGVVGFFYAQNTLTARGPLTSAKIITIKRGMGTEQISNLLKDQGVISNPTAFMVATYAFRSRRGSLKAGEYQIPSGATMSDVLGLLQSGKSLAYKVTIPEGWTSQNALKRIAANTVLTGEITIKPGEGSLRPDTYIFQRGTKRDDLIKRMQKAQSKLMDELWAKRVKGLPIKTRAEALTLASIVEKETGVKSERAHVASVFINRLNKKMRLQTDPTIIYGIVGGKGKMDRGITKADIAKKTAYNTYQIDGLPPTPIANPGRAALAAVLNPAKTDDLFFVADGTGGHAFARTHKGHLANVAKWRKIEHERAKAAKNKKKAAPSTSTAASTAAQKKAGQPVVSSSAKSDKATKKKPVVKTPKKSTDNMAKTSDGKTIALPPVKRP